MFQIIEWVLDEFLIMDNGYHLNVVMINPSILELSVKNPSPILMWNDQIKEAAIEIEKLLREVK